MIEYLQPQALICGVDPINYWDYTIAEIILIVKAYNERQKTIMINNYNLASMITSFIGCALAGESIPPMSELFNDNSNKDEDNLRNKFLADQWQLYAKQYNQIRHKQEEN